MKLIKLLLAAFIFSCAAYLLLLGGEQRATVLSSIGVTLKHSTAMVISIQLMVLGLILGAKTIFESNPVYKN